MEFGRLIEVNNKLVLLLNEETYSLKGNINALFGEEIPLNANVKIKEKIKLKNNNTNLENMKYELFCILEENTIVAKACIIYDTSEDEYAVRGKSIFINSLGVLENRKHEGLGTALINYIINTLNDVDIFLAVELKNKIAYSFYNKLGFQLKEHKFTDDNEPYDILILHKK